MALSEYLVFFLREREEYLVDHIERLVLRK
jgi:hypothetical protein